MNEKKYQIVSFSLSSLATILGMVVMIGWIIKSSAIVQVFPTYVPMQFNTAFCLFLSAVSLIFSCIYFRFIPILLSCIALLLASLTLSQDIFHLNLGIDQLFVKAFVSTKTLYPGRMSPYTAISFTFLNLALILRYIKNWDSAIRIAVFFEMFVISMTVTALLGYLTKTEEAFRWRGLTGMAIHTSLGILFLGVAALFQSYTFNLQGKLLKWIWIPITLTVGLIAINFFRAFEVNRIFHISENVPYQPNPISVFIFVSFGIFCFYLIVRLMKSIEDLENEKITAEISSKLKSRIIHYVSHEIRNPLSAIIGFSEPYAQRNDLTPEIKEGFESIYITSYHMKAVVDDLLAISRFESGKIQLHMEEFVLADWLNKPLLIFKKRAENTQINFEYHQDQNLPPKCTSDPSKLVQILVNLFENAIKFTPEKGQIILSIYAKETSLFFSLKDSGKGIPKDVQEKLFQPFFQVSQEEEKLGLGLGLSICKKYLDMMNGTIKIESEEGKGTTFIIELKNAVC